MCGQSFYDVLWQYWNTAWLPPARCILYTAITFCLQDLQFSLTIKNYLSTPANQLRTFGSTKPITELLVELKMPTSWLYDPCLLVICSKLLSLKSFFFLSPFSYLFHLFSLAIDKLRLVFDCTLLLRSVTLNILP